ncbi:MAG: hypothetical protein JWO36_1738 [Myxococcales bacterium]|nr:hypothetical protein [Myxococcales bacterium]
MEAQRIQPIDLLRTLGQKYQHMRNDLHHLSRDSGPHRRLGHKLDEITGHFERLLGEWVRDESLRTHWREFFHGREAPPDEPAVPASPVFKGRTEAGAIVIVRPAPDGYDIIVDGALLDRGTASWNFDPDIRTPIRIADRTYEEIFDAPPIAIAALRQFILGGEPPWPWARELIEDGLIDTELALTSRGRRRLT